MTRDVKLGPKMVGSVPPIGVVVSEYKRMVCVTSGGDIIVSFGKEMIFLL